MTDRKWTLPCLTNYLLARGTFCALVNSCIIRCIPASPLSVGLCWNRPKRCALNMNLRFQHLAAPPDWSRSNPINTLKSNQNLPPPSSHKKYIEQSFINATDYFSYPHRKVVSWRPSSNVSFRHTCQAYPCSTPPCHPPRTSRLPWRARKALRPAALAEDLRLRSLVSPRLLSCRWAGPAVLVLGNKKRI